MSPGPLDGILRSELAGKEFLYTRIENLKILAGTWNVAQGRASQDSLVSWLGSAAGDIGIVVVGLQEVEMGAGVLAMSAAKETVKTSPLLNLASMLLKGFCLHGHQKFFFCVLRKGPCLS
jgi:hypothetical protein